MDGAPYPLLGDILVVLAQLFAAAQFIVEEKYLAKYEVPALLAVGLEVRCMDRLAQKKVEHSEEMCGST